MGSSPAMGRHPEQGAESAPEPSQGQAGRDPAGPAADPHAASPSTQAGNLEATTGLNAEASDLPTVREGELDMVAEIIEVELKPQELDIAVAETRSVLNTPTEAGNLGSAESDAETDSRLEPIVPAETYASWVALVDRIQAGATDGMAELYELFSRGIRFYLCRQLGPQELDDRVHDTFVVVVQAIRRGELREPERLMGFVRTIVRRQVAAHIDKAVQNRKEQTDLDATVRLVDTRGNPEEAAMFRQRTAMIQQVLSELSERDREILTRFYLQEQGQEQICEEMGLTETQFRLLKSRAKARFGELGKKKLVHRNLQAVFVRTSAGVAH